MQGCGPPWKFKTCWLSGMLFMGCAPAKDRAVRRASPAVLPCAAYQSVGVKGRAGGALMLPVQGDKEGTPR